MVVRAVRQIFEDRALEQEYLPEEIRRENGLCEINFAVEQIHFPDNMEMLRKRESAWYLMNFFSSCWRCVS